MTERQSKEILASMFLKLDRGDTVTQEEARKAREHYNAFVIELDNLKYISNLNETSETNLPPQDKVRKENEKLQREYDNLKEGYDNIKKELEFYKRKPACNISRRIEKGCNTDITGEECASQEQRQDRLKNEGLRYRKNKEEEENVREENKKLHLENENLKKSHDLISKELEVYKRKPEEYSLCKRTEIGCNTDNTGADCATCTQIHKLEQHKHKKHDEGLRFLKNKEKEGQEADLSTAVDKLRKRNQQLIEEKGKLNDQIKELTDRLSMMAGQRLTAGNPDITDLSDAYRPTKVAEQFSMLYDDEWTSAFEELQSFTYNEVEVIDILAKLVKDLDRFCTRAQQQQLERLTEHAVREILELEYNKEGHLTTAQKGVRTEGMSQSEKNLADRLLKDFRKSFGILSVQWLIKSFCKGYMSPFVWESKRIPSLKALRDFSEKALKLVWVMKIQDPPMELTWCNKGDAFNKNIYNYYTNRGNTVGQCVWPAVLLHKDGPLMSKGVVQGM